LRQGARRIVALTVLECGRFAAEALAAGAPGVVRAAFRRSCYLEFPGARYLCLGDRSLGRGPLNALIEPFAPPALGVRLFVSTERARTWRPRALCAEPSAGALDALREAARARLPEEGLGGLIAGSSTPLIEHARASLGALERWLAGTEAAPEAEGLIGLGPGLTPSGDDYLGGMLVGLRAFGRARLAERLWHWLAPRLNGRTSAISAAHLAAAAEGEAHEALHDCLETLLGAERADWSGPLARLAALGHCSGWDGLAGVLAALRAS
jgi:hypothetical protein